MFDFAILPGRQLDVSFCVIDSAVASVVPSCSSALFEIHNPTAFQYANMRDQWRFSTCNTGISVLICVIFPVFFVVVARLRYHFCFIDPWLSALAVKTRHTVLSAERAKNAHHGLQRDQQAVFKKCPKVRLKQ